MPEYYSTRDAAELFDVAEWQVRRLFQNGDLPEPGRFGGKRAIPRAMLPQILDSLRARGWLARAEASPA